MAKKRTPPSTPAPRLEPTAKAVRPEPPPPPVGVAEIFKSRRGNPFKEQFYFRLIGTNGEKVAQSEAYTQKHNVQEVLRKYFFAWKVNDLT